MSENGSHHQRSYSDSYLCLAVDFDDLNFFDPFVQSSLPSLDTTDIVPMVIDLDRSDDLMESIGTPIPNHPRSLSADSYFFNEFSELETKYQMLKDEAINLSAQNTILQTENIHLTEDCTDLTMLCEAMEEESRLQDELNEALKEEVRLRRAATNLSYACRYLRK